MVRRNMGCVNEIVNSRQVFGNDVENGVYLIMTTTHVRNNCRLKARIHDAVRIEVAGSLIYDVGAACPGYQQQYSYVSTMLRLLLPALRVPPLYNGAY
jgi:hypothetical protein